MPPPPRLPAPLLLLLLAAAAAAAAAGIPRACSTPSSARLPFCNASLPLRARLDDLVARLPLAAKPRLLTAREGAAGAVASLGVPAYDYGLNAQHGVQSACGTRCPTTFPSPAALGAAWDDSLVRAMGAAIGLEARALWLQGVGEFNSLSRAPIGLDVWSPNLNVLRDARWGRAQEVPGEDPRRAAAYGAAYTRGTQLGDGADPRYLLTATTLKHWAAYSLEAWGGVTRHSYNAVVTPHDLADTYFPAIRAGVAAGAASVMCSYNALNGTPACASQFLDRVLRGAWGFDGYVSSDSGAVDDFYRRGGHGYCRTAAEAAAAALAAGTDVNSGSVYNTSLAAAVGQGLASWDAVDTSLRRALAVRFRLGLFDPVEGQPYWHVPPEAVASNATRALNLRAALASLVLLRNEGGVLPLRAGGRLAVAGPQAARVNGSLLGGHYWGQACPSGPHDFSCVPTPLEALQGALGAGSVLHAEGCGMNETLPGGEEAAAAAARAAGRAVLFLGLDKTIEGETLDRRSLGLPAPQASLLRAVAATGVPLVVVLLNGGPVTLGPELLALAPAVLEAWHPGLRGAEALRQALFGEYSPGGKMPVTVFPLDYVDRLDMESMSMTAPPGRTYRYYQRDDAEFAFGHGLSYTSFRLGVTFGGGGGGGADNSSVTLPTAGSAGAANATVSVTVANTGAMDGDEVVQLYFVPLNVTLRRPLPAGSVPLRRQLFAWSRVAVPAGGAAAARFQVSAADLLLVDADGARVSAPGRYSVVVTCDGVTPAATLNVTLAGAYTVVEPFPGGGGEF